MSKYELWYAQKYVKEQRGAPTSVPPVPTVAGPLFTTARFAMSSVPPQLLGTRWCTSRPYRCSHPGQRQ
jgi:hypothetical protein